MAKKTSSTGRVSGRPKVERKRKSGSVSPVKRSSAGRVSGSLRMTKPTSKKLRGSGTKTRSAASRSSVKRMSKQVSGTKKKLIMRRDKTGPLRHQHK